LFTVMVVVFIS